MRMIRMNNLQASGWDFTDLKHIEVEEALLEKYRLMPGDLLFNRTNSKELVGKCEVFQETGDWVFASYLIRVRLDTSRILPEFVSEFLNCPAGRIQIDQVSRQIAGMSNVNAEELKDLVVPLPPVAIQKKMLAELNRARATRNHALHEAEALLGSFDILVKSKLGLREVKRIPQGSYAVRLSDTKAGGTLSPQFYHPERTSAVRQISRHAHAPLRELVSFQRNIVKTPGETRYIGLASVAGNTGQLTNAVETATGACFRFEKGDVLFGRLRPYLNKVWHATFSGTCSTEFHVMRCQESDRIQAQYLSVVMRTGLIVGQTKHMMAGNTHPRLTNEDVGNLLIPLADESTQKEIVATTLERQREATRLHSHAELVWKEARSGFEKQLLKGAAP